MKENPEAPEHSGGNPLLTPNLRPGPAAATGIAFLLCLILILYGPKVGTSAEDIREFEAGKVAERDVIAEHPASYIDEAATQLRLEAQHRLVSGVFVYSPGIVIESQREYNRFGAFSREQFAAEDSSETYSLRVLAAFPGYFTEETLTALFKAPDRLEILRFGGNALDHIMEEGIFALPQTGLETYNPDMVELLRSSGVQTARERVPFSRIITLEKLREALDRYASEEVSQDFRQIVFDLIRPFLKENVFFSFQDTKRRLEETSDLSEPVVKYIEPGTRIIRRGFIITEEDMIRLRALNEPVKKDLGMAMGRILLFLLIYGLFVFVGSVNLIGRRLRDGEIYLLSALTALYLIGAAFAEHLPFNTKYFPVSIVLPTALAIMLPSILIGPPLALAWAMILPLGAFLSGSFDEAAYIFALVSGVLGSYTLQKAQKRMDLVKTGLIIAGGNVIAAGAVLLVNGAGGGDYPAPLFWAAFNGVASGMLVLGVLPPLEQVLNAATAFRLIELSDLNTPLLKRLFTVASGTYSHSIMVANLAEAACQEIGANPLLARVGAYYHDIGKMEQPDYFVENQTSYNKHNDISPSLSATIIRSHVRIGVEKARSLGLPREVTDIVAEHHGNSVITWFYSKALEQDPQANPEDFSYPGSPPRSRESAVVMLADMCEAAVRTMDNPRSEKIDAFIQELITSKIEHGQLAASELTFRDLETIRRAFVQVLAGYYHSRIKYPKIPPSRPVPPEPAVPAEGNP
ncbi:MAG: HDIG domain-containing protein [Spirochaetaceae bacterium]|jgi:putative nucleotidyltransferase with HDIG domain|nr:HDIG domain-containing protein [Spirochaetaceae bacterium]